MREFLATLLDQIASVIARRRQVALQGVDSGTRR
jgi:hypothetical protein